MQDWDWFILEFKLWHYSMIHLLWHNATTPFVLLRWHYTSMPTWPVRCHVFWIAWEQYPHETPLTQRSVLRANTHGIILTRPFRRRWQLFHWISLVVLFKDHAVAWLGRDLVWKQLAHTDRAQIKKKPIICSVIIRHKLTKHKAASTLMKGWEVSHETLWFKEKIDSGGVVKQQPWNGRSGRL